MHGTARHCTALHCTVLYCTVLYCTVLYCTVLYCTVLYCTVPYLFFFFYFFTFHFKTFSFFTYTVTWIWLNSVTIVVCNVILPEKKRRKTAHKGELEKQHHPKGPGGTTTLLYLYLPFVTSLHFSAPPKEG